MKLSLWFTVILLLSTMAEAADLSLHVGVGMGKSVLDSRTFERVGSLGLSYGNTWRVQVNGGYVVVPANQSQSTPFFNVQGGIQVVGDGGMFVGVMFGPGYFHNLSEKNSGHLQFHLSTKVGVRSKGGYVAGLAWEHDSDAGRTRPNYGLDVLMLITQIPIVIWD